MDRAVAITVASSLLSAAALVWMLLIVDLPVALRVLLVVGLVFAVLAVAVELLRHRKRRRVPGSQRWLDVRSRQHPGDGGS